VQEKKEIQPFYNDFFFFVLLMKDLTHAF